jgi:hypothetical protein
MRRRLPDRRAAVALVIEHGGQRFRVHVGYFPDGGLAEVFVDAAKPNSAIDAVAADSAILVSLLLQRGSTPSEIGHALRRTPAGEPASLIGAVIAPFGRPGEPPRRYCPLVPRFAVTAQLFRISEQCSAM